MLLKDIKSLGPVKEKALGELGIASVDDLLNHLPRRYENRTRIIKLSDVKDNVTGLIEGVVIGIKSRRINNKKEIITVTFETQGTILSAVFMNISYIKKKFRFQEEYALYGKIEKKGRFYSIFHPEFAHINEKSDFAQILPVYPLGKGLKQTDFRKFIKHALTEHIDDPFMEDFRERHKLCSLDYAYKQVHFPSSREDYKAAKFRLILQEFFDYIFHIRLLNEKKELVQGISFKFNAETLERFYELLPYEPTQDQRNAIDAIRVDLAASKQMNRLLQGDVGSGKSTVAFGSIFMTALSGYQSAYMAPTEILAIQQAESLSNLLSPVGIKVGLLTSQTKNKKTFMKHLQNGEIDVVVGTQAIIQDYVKFYKLGLVVVDEQHRFGVNQRELLVDKGVSPNYLVMSATPIPRTLSLILYGNMDISIIKQMPKGRKPILTYRGYEKERTKYYDQIIEELGKGHQAYIVYPLIEDSDKIDLKSVESGFEEVLNYFTDKNVGVLHGSMKNEEKELVMKRFKEKELDILVSTTVIEVGVDVPNATVMLIENAERFGLSQLHQLRGRVGRGEAQSYCFLLNNGSDKSDERLQVLVDSTDGFVIAERDLELRGPGELTGNRQHGDLNFKVADLLTHSKILKEARNLLDEIFIDENLRKYYIDRAIKKIII